MKRLMLVLILAMIATAARAEWTAMGGTDEFTTYVDRATIRRSGNLVKMWELFDYNSVQTKFGLAYSILSVMYQDEYDCKNEQIRRLAFVWHDGNMGSGKAVFSDSDTGKWSPIAPGSIALTLWKVACGKK